MSEKKKKNVCYYISGNTFIVEYIEIAFVTFREIIKKNERRNIHSPKNTVFFNNIQHCYSWQGPYEYEFPIVAQSLSL